MYISKLTDEVRFIEMTDIEFRVLKKMIDKLLFNPAGVSNQFKVEDFEVHIVNKMRTQLNAER